MAILIAVRPHPTMGWMRAACRLLGVLSMVLATDARADPGGERFTLEAAVEEALGQTRAVVRAKADVLILDNQKTRAWANVLPTLDVLFVAAERFKNRPITEIRYPLFCNAAGVTPGECEERGFDYIEGPFDDRAQLNNSSDPRLDVVITARQLLYDSGRSWEAIAQADDRKRRYEALLEAVENNVRLDVVRTFYGLESAMRATETFEYRVALGEAQLERARSLMSQGRGKAADVANAERNLAEDRVTLARRRFNESRQRRALNLVMARAADAPIRIELPHEVATATAPLSALRLPAPEDVKATALEHRPDLIVTRILLDEVAHDVTMNAARYGPTLTLDANYRRGSRRPDRVFDDPTTNFIATLGVTLRWNLFEGFRTDALVAESELALVKVQADYDDLERRVLAEGLDRLENLHITIQVFELARDAYRSAEDAVHLVRRLFEEGKNTALELRDAELKYTNAQLALIDARLQVEVAREELRRAVGAEML
ncbi:MAG: TolC family protein [Myxococcales bacterium]|nr:TolC family protein [Myxococcales bacterium]